MRIISGKYKGQRLVGFKGSHIRPTTDRVKESVFNILGPEIFEARVLDLFSGTGNLSIECLSRGAAWVDSVESHPGSLKIIRQNFEKLGIKESSKIYAQDVFSYLKKYQGAPYDVILIDPPFTQKWGDRCMDELSGSKTFSKNTTIILESTTQEFVDSQYGVLEKYDERHFGDKTVFFFSQAGDNN